MGKHIHVVVNPASGQNEPILNTLNDVFHPAGVTWSASVTQAYGDAINQAREAAEGGVDRRKRANALLLRPPGARRPPRSPAARPAR